MTIKLTEDQKKRLSKMTENPSLSNPSERLNAQNTPEMGDSSAKNTSDTRDGTGRRQMQEQVATLHDQSQNAIAALARVGVNGINAQMFEFDSKLAQFEANAAQAMADRMRQSQTRIAMLLAQELSMPAQANKGFGDVIGEVLEVPDLSASWLSIAPSAIAGCLPM